MKVRKTMTKAIWVIAVATVVALSAVAINSTATNAATSSFEKTLKKFPSSYRSKLRKLHKKYPKWKFTPFNTGLKFDTVVSKETLYDRAMIEKNYNYLLKSNAKGDYANGHYITKDAGVWVSVTKYCAAYFLDPRNFLDDTYIYQFESLSYASDTHTQSGVESILSGSFMHNTKICYLNTKGKYVKTNTKYSAIMLSAAKSTKVSPNYVASKILQEIGGRKNSKYKGMGASKSICGNYSKTYRGIYNFYNIGAYSSSNPIANGLSWAKNGKTYSRPWNTPMKSITGGAQFIGKNYINAGQNTIYLQKFNVNKKAKNELYEHQYMTNIYGAAAEGYLAGDAYSDNGTKKLAKKFIIPVYKSMPSLSKTLSMGKAKKPAVATAAVSLRKGASTGKKKVLTLKKKEKLTVLGGVRTSRKWGDTWMTTPYWYKVTLKRNGKTYKGYVSSMYVSLNIEKKLTVGKKIKLPVKSKKKGKIYYRSDKKGTVAVDSKGYITAKKVGSTTVRAFTASGKMAVMKIKVVKKAAVKKTTKKTNAKKTTKKTSAQETTKKITAEETTEKE